MNNNHPLFLLSSILLVLALIILYLWRASKNPDVQALRAYDRQVRRAYFARRRRELAERGGGTWWNRLHWRIAVLSYSIRSNWKGALAYVILCLVLFLPWTISFYSAGLSIVCGNGLWLSGLACLGSVLSLPGLVFFAIIGFESLRCKAFTEPKLAAWRIARNKHLWSEKRKNRERWIANGLGKFLFYFGYPVLLVMLLVIFVGYPCFFRVEIRQLIYEKGFREIVQVVDVGQRSGAAFPFAADEMGVVEFFRPGDDGCPVSGWCRLDGSDARGFRSARECLPESWEGWTEPFPDFVQTRLSDARFLQMVRFYGLTNDAARCFAIGFFGNGGIGIRAGTGRARMEAFFPDVASPEDADRENHGYKLVATWENENREGSVKGEQIRFGLDPEPGVCMLIPPEAFNPGAVTKLRGDGPDSVEYWVERLRSAPCGKWEIPDLGR